MTARIPLASRSGVPRPAGHRRGGAPAPHLRRALALVGALACLAGCGGTPVIVRRSSCFTGPVAHVGRKVPDEMFALLRRESDRAAKAPPLVRARILESLHSLFPDTSDLWPSPECHDELEREGLGALAKEPLVFDRELIARVRTVHDAPPLLSLAARHYSDLPDYHLGPDEPGPPPPKSFLRYRALANIPSGWIVGNRPAGRRLLLDWLRSSGDPTEHLLLQDAAEALYQQALGGDPAREGAVEGRLLLGGFIDDVARRLKGPPDRAALELVVLRIADMGHFGARLGHEPAARAVVKAVLDAKGQLPITKGIPGGARDLVEVARAALFELDTPQKSTGYLDPPRPRRVRFDPRADWLDREPAGGRPSEVDRAARVRDLDAELASLTYNVPRCHILRQLGEWLSDAEAEARFEALVAPAFKGDRVVLTTESVCRLQIALALPGVPEDRRMALAARMLRTPLPAARDRDLALDEQGPAIAHPVFEDPVRQSAAAALARNPTWVDRSTEVRSWLEQRALEPIPREADPAATWSALGPAFERAVDFHLSGRPGAEPDTARATLKAWMESVRTALSGKLVGHIYLGEVVTQRIRAVADRGRAAGMTAEVAAFLDGLPKRRDVVVARYLLDLETPR